MSPKALTEEQLSASNSILFKIRCDLCHGSILTITPDDEDMTVKDIVAELKAKKSAYILVEDVIKQLACEACKITSGLPAIH
jgi:hypothetical protein